MSIRRAAVAASLAALSFASFAGCSEDAPAPRPTSTSAACSPSSAKVAFSKASAAGAAVVGAYLIRYSSESQAWGTAGLTPVQVDPVWNDEDLGDIVSTAEGQRTWERALLDRANRTGQFAGRFGDASGFDLPTDASAHPAVPSRATWVVTISVPRYALPFTISCPQSERPLTGSITAPTYESPKPHLYRCGVVATTDDARIARGFCP